MSEKIQKIRQEIERRIDLYSIAEKDDSTFARMGELSSLMDFIDSIPEEPASEDLENQYKSNMRYQHAYTQDDLMKTKNEDLEEEIKKLDNWYPVEIQYIREIAHHFAEWGRNHFEDKSEMTNNDLEKAAVSVIKKLGGMEPDDNVSYHEVKIFKADAEWQKQQMMKNTVLETKVIMDCDGDGIETSYEEWLTLEDTEIPYIPEELGLKEGDKVKIIIVK